MKPPVKSKKSSRKPTPPPAAPEIPAVDKRWFLDRMHERQLTGRALAKALDLDPSAITLMLSSRRKMQLHEAEKIAGIFMVPTAQVLAAAGLDMEAGSETTIPVVGWVDDDGEVHAHGLTGARHVPAPIGLPKQTTALRYRSDGPSEGWLAYFVPVTGMDPDSVGRLCVAEIESPEKPGKKETYIRNVARGHKRGVWNLIGLRPAERRLEGVRILMAAPVSWLKT